MENKENKLIVELIVCLKAQLYIFNKNFEAIYSALTEDELNDLELDGKKQRELESKLITNLIEQTEGLK